MSHLKVFAVSILFVLSPLLAGTAEPDSSPEQPAAKRHDDADDLPEA